MAYQLPGDVSEVGRCTRGPVTSPPIPILAYFPSTFTVHTLVSEALRKPGQIRDSIGFDNAECALQLQRAVWEEGFDLLPHQLHANRAASVVQSRRSHGSLSAASMLMLAYMALLVPSVPQSARIVVGARSRATPECDGPQISLCSRKDRFQSFIADRDESIKMINKLQLAELQLRSCILPIAPLPSMHMTRQPGSAITAWQRCEQGGTY